MNSVQYFEIHVANPEQAINFYRHVFGRSFEKAENLPMDYRRIRSDGINWWLLQRPAATPPAQYWANAFVNSIQVANFDEAAKLIIDNWWKVALPKFAIPWTCYQWYFLDTEGNVFGVFEVNPEAK